MRFFLYRLRFTTPVHFGGDEALSLENAQMAFCADTLFSALCHAALLSGGDEAASSLCDMVRQDLLLLSDGMPWHRQGGRETYYLPRPILTPARAAEGAPEKRKEIKKLRYLPVTQMDAYLRGMREGVMPDVSKYRTHFGQNEERVRAARPEGEQTLPYFVGTFHFDWDCGLYFLAGIEGEAAQAALNRYLTLLQYSGIGGKISSGYGKFLIEERICLDDSADEQAAWLRCALGNGNAKVQMALSVCLPRDEELDAAMDGAQYQLLRRGGFVHRPMHSNSAQKKQTQYVFSAGSTFCARFEGQLSEVGRAAGHGVYRYNKPLWLGVNA